jgi:hypothetical protein
MKHFRKSLMHQEYLKLGATKLECNRFNKQTIQLKYRSKQRLEK